MWPHQLNLKPVAVARLKPRWTRIQQQAHASLRLPEMASEWRYSGTTAHAHWHCGTLVNDNPGPGPGPPSGDSLRPPHTAAVYKPQCTHGGLGWALRGWYPSSNCAEPQPPGRTPALLKLWFIVLFQGSSTTVTTIMIGGAPVLSGYPRPAGLPARRSRPSLSSGSTRTEHGTRQHSAHHTARVFKLRACVQAAL
jgi:hypothetical protein